MNVGDGPASYLPPEDPKGREETYQPVTVTNNYTSSGSLNYNPRSQSPNPSVHSDRNMNHTHSVTTTTKVITSRQGQFESGPLDNSYTNYSYEPQGPPPLPDGPPPDLDARDMDHAGTPTRFYSNIPAQSPTGRAYDEHDTAYANHDGREMSHQPPYQNHHPGTDEYPEDDRSYENHRGTERGYADPAGGYAVDRAYQDGERTHVTMVTQHERHIQHTTQDSFDQQQSYRNDDRYNGPDYRDAGPPYANHPQDPTYHDGPPTPRSDHAYPHGSSTDIHGPGGDAQRPYGGGYQDTPPQEQEGRYQPQYSDPPPNDLDRYSDRPYDRVNDLRHPADLRGSPLPPDDARRASPRDSPRGEMPPDGRYSPDDRNPYDRPRGQVPYGSRSPDPRYMNTQDDNPSLRTASPAHSSVRGPYGSQSIPPQDDPAGYGSDAQGGYASHPLGGSQPGLHDQAGRYGSQGLPPNDEDLPPYDEPHADDSMFREEMPRMLGDPHFDADPNRRSPSIDSFTREQRWRNPDLPEVIEYLGHPSNAIKANAAAYLQHLCYMDDAVKSKARALGGIPALVELVKSEVPEVHRTACGALRNLSYGRSNDENKRAIKNAGGISELVRLLRKSPDNDVRELVTGIIWNLSSLKELKKPVIDESLTVLVNAVVIPHSGWKRSLSPNEMPQIPRDVYWSTVFRNGSGVLRNVSSDGQYARTKLRECEGLPDSLMFIVRAAIGKNDIDNKSVENCICVLRNLSYACQEVDDEKYLEKRNQKNKNQGGKDNTGCFGGSSSNSSSKKKKDSSKNEEKREPRTTRTAGGMVQGMELLWQPDVVHVYLPLLSDCSNPETLEAAAGAVQNLAACDWSPSVEIRATVRKEKGLPIIVELLNLEADRVVCAAATALRNLALDQRNKELVGKYAMKQLVTKLPSQHHQQEYQLSDDTICAIEATLYEVIKNNVDFAQSLYREGGVHRLVHITQSRMFSQKVCKYASTLLTTMWNFKELQADYKRGELKESDFTSRPIPANSTGRTPPPSATNTLGRPAMTQSGPAVPGYNENTMPHVTRGQQPANMHPEAYGNGYPNSIDLRDPYGSRDKMPREEIAMNQMGGGSTQNVHHGTSNPAYYDTLGSRTDGGSVTGVPDRPPYPDDYDRRTPQGGAYSPHQSDSYVPPGGVALFPNLPPGSQQPQPQEQPEPLYARVNKHGGGGSIQGGSVQGEYNQRGGGSLQGDYPQREPDRQDHIEFKHGGGGTDGPQGGADSWV